MAGEFRFRLETVLDLRRQREQQQQRVVAETVRQIGRLKNRLTSVNRQIGDSIDESMQSRSQPHLNVLHISRQRYWISHLQRELRETEQVVLRLEQKLEEDRRNLAEAARQVKVLETLREKQLREYQREQRRLETIESDELSVIYHRRLVDVIDN